MWMHSHKVCIGEKSMVFQFSLFVKRIRLDEIMLNNLYFTSYLRLNSKEKSHNTKPPFLSFE